MCRSISSPSRRPAFRHATASGCSSDRWKPKLRGLDGLKELTAVANQSNALVVLEFEIGTDKDKVLADIRDKVDQAKAEFPADANEPVIAETNFALQPTLIVTLSGNVPERTLYGFSRRLKDELEAIDTVREANLRGNREEQLEVILDLAKLESYNITQGELLNALAQNNQLVAAGFIDNGAGRFNVKVPGLVEDAQDVYSIPIKQNGEAVVSLGDVSEIRRTFKDASVLYAGERRSGHLVGSRQTHRHQHHREQRRGARNRGAVLEGLAVDGEDQLHAR